MIRIKIVDKEYKRLKETENLRQKMLDAYSDKSVNSDYYGYITVKT